LRSPDPRSFLVAVLLAASTLVLSATIAAQSDAPQSPRTPAIMGFTSAGAQKEFEIEQHLKAIPSPEQARAFHRIFTTEPHPAASERNNELARYIADTWKKQGLEQIAIHRYDVLNSYPRNVVVEMISPKPYVASLREEPYAIDPDTKNPRVKRGYLSMSASGEITAPVIYAHSGNPEDYEVLRQHGIDVRGKIVLVRYSNPYSYRGFKALTAQRQGAAGILIYSDPAEDGYKKGAVFPDGPWGPETHIQRGAITYDFIVPGDPLTPGWASVPGAKRIAPEQAASLPKIMGVAMSWHDAKPLLENVGGPVAPDSWQGGLPITYRLGGEARVHLKVDMDTSVKPNYVVEARIRGSEFPDELVLLGNHRDAWEFGGVDPSSGTASMMELSRAMGELLKSGVRPKRTLVFCSWDGEEIGLTGSTEWGEQFGDDLRKNLVAYLNVDSSTSGPDFDGSAIASLAPFLIEASHSLQDPSGKSLYDAWRASTARIRKEEKNAQPVDDSNLVNTRIGSGSDHTVFLNFLGRPVIGLEFNGPYGVYHSMYDDFYWMNHFGDPGYRYHVLMSQLWGVLALRLANSDVLPFDFRAYGDNLWQFLDEVQKKSGASDHLDFSPLYKDIAEFKIAGDQLDQAVQARLSRPVRNNDLDRINRELMQVEGNWLNSDGIPGRPWFKHMLYAARYTYAHLELPGLTEAVEAGKWDVARQQAAILQDAVAKNTKLIRQIREELVSPATAANTK
jgi:N-acetylated-alpha-linked acidic dipeptidase